MNKEDIESLIDNAKEIVRGVGASEFKRCADEILKEIHEDGSSGCFIWYLDRYNDDGYDYALVMGETDGIDDFHDSYSNEDFSIGLKIARQSSNNGMQCDYDIDWEYPYYEDSGECIVYENTITKDCFDHIVEQLEWDIEHFFKELYNQD